MEEYGKFIRNIKHNKLKKYNHKLFVIYLPLFLFTFIFILFILIKSSNQNNLYLIFKIILLILCIFLLITIIYLILNLSLYPTELFQNGIIFYKSKFNIIPNIKNKFINFKFIKKFQIITQSNINIRSIDDISESNIFKYLYECNGGIRFDIIFENNQKKILIIDSLNDAKLIIDTFILFLKKNYSINISRDDLILFKEL